MSKGRNGDEVVEQSSLPQVNLEIMEPEVCLVCLKLDLSLILLISVR